MPEDKNQPRIDVESIQTPIQWQKIEELEEASEGLSKSAEEEQKSYYENRKNKAEVAKAEELVRILKQDRLERQRYARHLFKLICCWLAGIYGVILLNGLNKSRIHVDTSNIPHISRLTFAPAFQLSDTVVLALIGGTTVNVLGLFVIVANYLFKSPTDAGKHNNNESR